MSDASIRSEEVANLFPSKLSAENWRDVMSNTCVLCRTHVSYVGDDRTHALFHLPHSLGSSDGGSWVEMDRV